MAKQMLTLETDAAYRFRFPLFRQDMEGSEISKVFEGEAKEPEEERKLLCRSCLLVITSRDERIDFQGSHEHTFANPHGLVYRFGCFLSAVGCRHTGVPSDDFTWFPGFKWRVALCGFCLTHLGWLFMKNTEGSFHGLIVDRLIDSQ